MVLLRIAPERSESELDLVWQREMSTAVHVARWLPVRREGGPVEAIAFVANRRQPPPPAAHAGRLPEERVLAALAAAEGLLGRCADYLTNTVAHLRRLGIREPRLATL